MDESESSKLIRQQEKALKVALFAMLAMLGGGGIALLGYERLGTMIGFVFAAAGVLSLVAFAGLKLREARENK